jgi:ketosteroid isomerase-like protein
VREEDDIQAMVDRETWAWDHQDAEALVSLFHPDMVWPWPPDSTAHDPASWVFPLGRYNRDRWKAGWQELFDAHELVHNRRTTVRIAVSAERDGGFAVVDVDTLWRRRADGALAHWKGRACKGYTKVGSRWLLIYHTGLLEYIWPVPPAARPPGLQEAQP